MARGIETTTNICSRPGNVAGSGRILGPVCGLATSLAQHAGFVEQHRRKLTEELALQVVKKLDHASGLCRMNLAA